ncbi:hypothetical protein VHEMI08045 [[Torrubiella] hemipterigena]|uniref:Glycogen debranching enzyme n=1 Tax=[Torrubiella] hemipterigena TaxID=1531966 RepID=A0A0A1TMG6_9HYPO|nr:hypothetical protein VHEMI08045 [[Torrubiella] hemipterigena]
MRLLLPLSFAGVAVAGCGNETCAATTLHLTDQPYQNYFYSDCHVNAQVVVTSPQPESNLSIIGPRLVVAWPAGNSGVCAFFQPQNGKNGTLGIEMVNSTLGSPIGPVYHESGSDKPPVAGVEGVMWFNSSAELSLAILGSVRTIRDFVEGPSLLNPMIQSAVHVSPYKKHGAAVTRLWLDNVTTTTLTLEPWKQDCAARVTVENGTVKLAAGHYKVAASFNYPQLKQLTPQEILNDNAQDLITKDREQVNALSFFSYSDKLLAGGWRFLTYFGRDSMISALLMQPILRTGSGSAMEAVIGAALERINKTDGSVSHEETIGDYATFLNLQRNLTSTAAGFTYQMIDTDYYLPVLMDRYFKQSADRVGPLLKTEAGLVDEENKNMTWGDLSYTLAQKIMNITAPFEQEQSVANLIHLKDGESVGQWRDSNRGLGNGRIPFDVNCALVPAALSAIASLAAVDGVYPKNDVTATWATAAAKRAKVWEDKTLAFFEHDTSVKDATSLLDNYVSNNTYYHGPSNGESLATYSNGSIHDYAISIKSPTDDSLIKITHTDTAFRNVLLNTTNDEQLTAFINSSSNAILRPFPAGLTTSVGAVVANPSLSDSPELIANLTNAAYHGTVVWGWQLALVARGFETQLARCTGPDANGFTPAFCKDDTVRGALKAAYNKLWDVIEANTQLLQSEVWSWTFPNNGTDDNGFKQVPLGVLPPPPGEGGGTESDIRQLWSLVFLAIQRNKAYST